MYHAIYDHKAALHQRTLNYPDVMLTTTLFDMLCEVYMGEKWRMACSFRSEALVHMLELLFSSPNGDANQIAAKPDVVV